VSQNFVKEKEQVLAELLREQQGAFSEKKPIKKVLSSYMKKKPINENSMKKMNKDFLDIKDNMHKARTSFETLMEIQKKLSKVYNDLNEKEDENKKTKKDS